MAIDLGQLEALESALAGVEGQYRQAHRALRAAADRTGELRAKLAEAVVHGRGGHADIAAARDELARLQAEQPALQMRERHLAEALGHQRSITDQCRKFAGLKPQPERRRGGCAFGALALPRGARQ